MLRDARAVPPGTLVNADVCVVGAGPAGITLALELAGRGVEVCLLESGGLEPDPAAQALCAAEVTGEPFERLDESRRRQFGGAANLWNSAVGDAQVGFRCGPLDPIDLEPRDWLPHYEGWPFGRDELDPFYARAQRVCALGPFSYGPESWEDERARRLDVDGGELATSVWQLGVQHTFTHDHREAVRTAPGLAAYLNANVVEIETTEAAGEVTALRVATLGGGEFRVAARAYVLATGGVENARLLLASDRVQRGGLGNGHDLVGRYFMAHQYVRCGELTPRSPELFERATLYDTRRVGGVLAIGKLDFTADVLRRERLLNVSAALLPRHRLHKRLRQGSVDSFVALARSAARLRLPEDAGRHLRNVVEGLDYVAAAMLRKASGHRLFRYWVPGPDLINGGGWAELPDKERRFATFEVILHAEQAPDPENRVTLTADRDALGNRMPRLHWRWDEASLDSVRRAQRVLAAALARTGLGTLRIELDGERPNLVFPGLHHHMGTTRMHADPARGVVDANCRVHGVGNLFVAGCSVFPTGGYINPTLTIVALAIRLADHLGGVVGGRDALRATGAPRGAARHQDAAVGAAGGGAAGVADAGGGAPPPP